MKQQENQSSAAEKDDVIVAIDFLLNGLDNEAARIRVAQHLDYLFFNQGKKPSVTVAEYIDAVEADVRGVVQQIVAIIINDAERQRDNQSTQ